MIVDHPSGLALLNRILSYPMTERSPRPYVKHALNLEFLAGLSVNNKMQRDGEHRPSQPLDWYQRAGWEFPQLLSRHHIMLVR